MISIGLLFSSALDIQKIECSKHIYPSVGKDPMTYFRKQQTGVIRHDRTRRK